MSRDLNFVAEIDIAKDSMPPFRLWRHWGFYSLAFFVTFCVSYHTFIISGRGFIWSQDGANDHFSALVYTGEFFREIARSILNGSFAMPLQDYRRFSQGGSVLGSQGMSLQLFDIFNILAVAVPYAKTEILYNVIVILRMFCAGLSFIYLCRHFRFNGYASIIGALSYVFCGWTMFWAVRQIWFGSILSFLPLMIVGLDRILLRKSPYLFILSVFITTLSGYYWFVMSGLCLFVFAVIRVHYLYPKNFLKQVFLFAAKSIGYCLIGVSISAFTLLPQIIAFFDSPRSGHSEFLAVLFPFNTYKMLFLNFFDAQSASSQFIGGMTALTAYAAISLLFKPNRRDKHILAFLSLFVLIYLLPNGHVFAHGVNYFSSRWLFQLAFVFSFVIAYRLPYLFKLAPPETIALMALPAVYLITMLSMDMKRIVQAPLSFGMLSLTLACLALPSPSTIVQKCGADDNVGAGPVQRKSADIKRILLFLVLLVNISLNAWGLYGSSKGYAKQFLNHGQIYTNMDKGIFQWPEQFSASNFFRIDTCEFSSANGSNMNRRLIFPFNSMENYNGIVKKSMQQYALVDLENIRNNYGIIFMKGFNGRSVPYSLMAVKYAAFPKSDKSFIPWGFSKVNNIADPKAILLKNDFFIPIAFAYSRAISYEEYSQLNSIRKQEATMQAAVLDSRHSDSSIDDLFFSSKEIFPEFSFENVVWKSPNIDIKDKGGRILLKYDGFESSETYIRFKQFFTPEILTPFGAQLSGTMRVRVESSGKKNAFIVANPRHPWYWQTDFLVNLGYSKKSRSTAVINFPRKGKFHLDDIQVFCYPMTTHAEYVKNLQANAATNIIVNSGNISCDVSYSEPKYLYFAVPYDEGWSAKIDGIDAPILRANTAFMALKLEKGAHHIELLYFTPGLRLGLILSLIGLFSFMLVWYFERH